MGHSVITIIATMALILVSGVSFYTRVITISCVYNMIETEIIF